MAAKLARLRLSNRRRYFDFDVFAQAGRLWDRVAVLVQSLDVELDGLTDELANSGERLPRRDASGHVWDVGTVTSRPFFENHGECHVLSLLSPACSRIPLRVHRGISTLGWPATVTFPVFLGCTNCRWLARARSSRHPSASTILITSRTFILLSSAAKSGT